MLNTQESDSVFQSLSKFSEEDIQYFARPTIDRIFEIQTVLQEEYSLLADGKMHSHKILNKSVEMPELEDDQPVRKNLPDPLQSKKIAKSTFIEKRKIPKSSLQILRGWLLSHIDDPYPTNQEKRQLAEAAKLTFKQVYSWYE